MKRMMACAWADSPDSYLSTTNHRHKFDIAVGKAPCLDATYDVATCSTPFGCPRNSTLPRVSVNELAVNTAGGMPSLITSSCALAVFQSVSNL